MTALEELMVKPQCGAMERAQMSR